MQSRAKTSDFNTLYEAGKYEEAKQLAAAGAANANEESDPLLWNLHAGACCIAGGQFESAVAIFDEAEVFCKEDDLQNDALKGTQTAGEILTNRYIVDYDPTQYDKTFVNYYKALSFMALGDFDSSRVEWNRVYERQRMAVAEFEKEISKTREELFAELEEQENAAASESGTAEETGTAADEVQAVDSGEEEETDVDVQRMVEAAKERMNEKGEQHQWQPYTDFVNPYPTYVGGLFWLTKGQDKGDYEKALDNFKRVKGMTECELVDQDIASAEVCLAGSGAKTAAKNVWVVFENGMGPILDEIRLDLPIFAVSQSSPIKTVSMALPHMKFRDKAYDYLEVVAGGATDRTTQLADIDRVVATEFDVYYDSILAKSIASTVAKMLGQVVAQEALGDAGALIVGIFNSLTTQADTRMWTALPKEVQVARVKLPKDGRLQLKSPQGLVLSDVVIPECNDCIVYVRIPKANIPAAVTTIPL
ncbi:hypothetical protein DPQ33_17445 [Oceanidesulfovibrio indonesiensis]|uniref:Tetratricopeptide repeat protein n=1 Tax=Oceanidesulfovibrio indonesiensis TaxID=54767 RepID=A0A7M3MA76_9BACT|nr:hypothetical protein [Oceanidesulfovibrio indonesiensis]TVM14500.1 hypothetical protein DPQ33_17445 [Oceanidesulfovibrio indonesiensis]